MSVEYFSPKSDIVFKLLFGDSKDVELLTYLLQSVLRLPAEEYEDVTITDPHLPRAYDGDKLGILDVKVLTKSKRVIDVEIQLLQKPAMRERIIFNLAKMVAGQISAGEGYHTIQPAICIFITDFVFVPENQSYHNRYTMNDPETGSHFSDLIEADILELPKLPDIEDGTELWKWMKFLSANREEDFEMIAEKGTGVRKAVGRLKELSADERTRLIVESWQMREWDNQGLARQMREDGLREGRQEGLREGLEQGLAQGLEQGLNKAQLGFVRNAIKMGMAMEEIVTLTGLSREEIEALRETL